VNVEPAAREVLRAIRGPRSQVGFARRLGYRANPVANWESGRRFPTALETLRACGRVGIDVQRAFERFVPAAAAGRVVTEDLAGWLSELRGSTSISELSRRSGRSRFAVSRWLSGQAQPRLPDFLRLLQAMTGRASDLVAELVPIASVPTLESDHRRRHAARGLAFEEPWTEAILRVLELCGEPVASERVARALAIDPGLAQRCLSRLQDAGLVEPRGDPGTGDAGYVVVGELTVDTGASPERIQHLKAHWTRVALERLAAPGPQDQFGYNVFTVSEPELEAIAAILRGAFREIRSLVANSEHSDAIGLINLQLVRLDHPAGPTSESPQSP